MCLDVFELIVHDWFDFRRSRNILAKQRRILFIRVGLNFPDNATAFGNIFLELSARLNSTFSKDEKIFIFMDLDSHVDIARALVSYRLQQPHNSQG